MMNHSLVYGALTALALTLGGSPGEAKAQTQGSFVISNPTSVTLNYQVKWGDGSWVNYSLAPGFRNAHSYPLNDAGRAPIPVVRFDGVGNGTREYRMEFYAVWDVFGGKPYAFGYDPTGFYLDLFAR